MKSDVYVPEGSPEIVALDKQQRQQPVVGHCQHLGQLEFVQLGSELELEHLAKHPEFVHPFCKLKVKKKLFIIIYWHLFNKLLQ